MSSFQETLSTSLKSGGFMMARTPPSKPPTPQPNTVLPPHPPKPKAEPQKMKLASSGLHDDDMADYMEEHGLHIERVLRNPSVAKLYEEALKNEKGSMITSTGALCAFSGAKTGRSPKDKRIVEEDSTKEDVWWGPVNKPMSERAFSINRSRAVDYLNMCDQLYVIDGYAGWDDRYRIKVRVICSRAYHALFMYNMLIRPSKEELENFGEPDWIIYNAGKFPANKFTEGMTSNTSVSINFATQEFVILGTQYAGEMKKGVFTIMHYLMPKMGVLSLHSSANVGPAGDVSVFFGLSGTGKTTLSADPARELIGDDEHCWTDHGVFNIEGGCYAKCVDLSREKEPEIFDAIRFGSVVENVGIDPESREIDFSDIALTENTRTAYPIEFIPNARLPCLAGHPKNVILLTCDAFGVLPPVSKLTPAQVMYHFISGYTAKVAGTEEGVTEPEATFSACFGQPFLVWHPTKYAMMLAQKLEEHDADAYLVNTGWTGGSFGVGKRFSLKHTRAIIDAIHNGSLRNASYEQFPVFNLNIPREVPGVPSSLLMPMSTWANREEYMQKLTKLAALFISNFSGYQSAASADIVAAGPQLQ